MAKLLPKALRNVVVPPVKCQGIKTRLVPFIAANIDWDGAGRWIEPFLGSGVVAFNIQPRQAILGDSNPHIIRLYRAIYEGSLTPRLVEEYLADEGAKLASRGADHYYAIRERFNDQASPLDFLFLNRSCFNGVMRFNSRGGFNVPFCRNPDRFRSAYITKIANQVRAVQDGMRDHDWTFLSSDWRGCLAHARPGDFVYLDPPYIGRHTDYYSHWNEEEASALAQAAQALPCGIALSMWKENKYRRNHHIDEAWSDLTAREIQHFYHVGSTESLRNEMTEALLITPTHAASRTTPEIATPAAANQLSFENL